MVIITMMLLLLLVNDYRHFLLVVAIYPQIVGVVVAEVEVEVEDIIVPQDFPALQLVAGEDKRTDRICFGFSVLGKK